MSETTPTPAKRRPSAATRAAAKLSAPPVPPKDRTASDKIAVELNTAMAEGAAADAAKAAPKAPAKPRAAKKAPVKAAPAKVVKAATPEPAKTSTEKPALVLTLARALRAAIKSPKVSDAEIVKILDGMAARASRTGTNSTPGQLARHAGIEAVAKLEEAAKAK